MSAITTLAAVMAVAAVARTAATIESAASAATAIGASAAITASIATSAIPSAITSTAKRPLETRTSPAANAGRIPRSKFFARAAVRSAGFAREEDRIFSSSCSSNLGRLGFVSVAVLALLFVFAIIFVPVELFVAMVVVLFVRTFMVLEFDVVAQRSDVKRIFMCGVGFRFGYGLRGADDFLNGRFVSFVFFALFFFAEVFFFLFFALFFVFLEYGATCGAIRASVFTDFVLLCVNQARRESRAFIVAEFCAVFAFLGASLSFFQLVELFVIEFSDLFRFGSGVKRLTGYFGSFRATTCQQPAGKGTAGTARSSSRAGQKICAARLFVFGKLGLRFVMNWFLDRRNRSRSDRAIAEFCERFAGQQERFFFHRSGWAGRRAGLTIASAFRAIVEIAPRAALVVAAAVATIFVAATIVALAALRSCVL